MPLTGISFSDSGLISEKPASPASSALVSDLKKAALTGSYNDADLRKVCAITGIKYVTASLADAGIPVQQCGGCHKLSFSINMQAAYGGKQYVCGGCRKAYYHYCSGCSSLILNADDQMHWHVPEMKAMQFLNNLLKYNQNIKTVTDTLSWKLMAKGERPSRYAVEHRFYGAELEVERSDKVPSPPDLVAKAMKCFPQGRVVALFDGSLSKCQSTGKKGYNGFEIVSVPMSLKAYLEEDNGWHKFFDVISPFAHSNPPTAGLHFHVNRSSVGLFTLGRVYNFINHRVNYGFLVGVSGRELNKASPLTGIVYAGTDSKNLKSSTTIRRKIAEVTSKVEHGSDCPLHPRWRGLRNYYYFKGGFKYDVNGIPIIADISGQSTLGVICKCPPGHYNFPNHYAALNLLTKKDTFEFRIFSALMSKMHFFSCLEFCDALINFCDQAPIDGLFYQKFLEWYDKEGLRKEYKYLTSTLVSCGYLTVKERRD